MTLTCNKIIMAALLFCTCLSLIACQGSIDGVETSKDEIAVETESIPIDNCGAPSPVTIRRAMSKTITHDVEITNSVSTGVNLGFISAGIAAEYGYGEGESESRSFEVEMTAPAYSRVVYTLEWFHEWRTGYVYDTETDEWIADYRFRKDIIVEIADSAEEDCQ